MNKDIERKLDMSANSKNKELAGNNQNNFIQKTTNPIKNDNLSLNVQKSLQEYAENQAYVEAHIELCDELVKKGYCLEDAIDKTDSIFEILKDKEIYN